MHVHIKYCVFSTLLQVNVFLEWTSEQTAVIFCDCTKFGYLWNNLQAFHLFFPYSSGLRSHGPFSHSFLWWPLLFSGAELSTFTSVQSPTGRLVVKALKQFYVCFSIESSLSISENASGVSSAEQGLYPAWFLWQPWHLAFPVCLCHVLLIYGETQFNNAWNLLLMYCSTLYYHEYQLQIDV